MPAWFDVSIWAEMSFPCLSHTRSFTQNFFHTTIIAPLGTSWAKEAKTQIKSVSKPKLLMTHCFTIIYDHFLPFFCWLGFRPIKHFKMTVWISDLWKINIHMAKKCPEPWWYNSHLRLAFVSKRSLSLFQGFGLLFFSQIVNISKYYIQWLCQFERNLDQNFQCLSKPCLEQVWKFFTPI